LFNCTGWQHM